MVNTFSISVIIQYLIFYNILHMLLLNKINFLKYLYFCIYTVPILSCLLYIYIILGLFLGEIELYNGHKTILYVLLFLSFEILFKLQIVNPLVRKTETTTISIR